MIEPTSDARQYRIIIRGECGRLLVSLIDNVEVEPAQGGTPVSSRWSGTTRSSGG
jgi:hypothetical protein